MSSTGSCRATLKGKDFVLVNFWCEVSIIPLLSSGFCCVSTSLLWLRILQYRASPDPAVSQPCSAVGEVTRPHLYSLTAFVLCIYRAVSQVCLFRAEISLFIYWGMPSVFFSLDPLLVFSNSNLFQVLKDSTIRSEKKSSVELDHRSLSRTGTPSIPVQ